MCFQALLKLDCQGLVARITQDTVIFTAAVKLGKNWRELAEKLARLTKQQIDAYETPHHNKNGEVAPEVSLTIFLLYSFATKGTIHL